MCLRSFYFPGNDGSGNLVTCCLTTGLHSENCLVRGCVVWTSWKALTQTRLYSLLCNLRCIVQPVAPKLQPIQLVLISYIYLFLGQVFVHVFWTFQKRLFVFLLLSFQNSLYIFIRFVFSVCPVCVFLLILLPVSWQRFLEIDRTYVFNSNEV